MELPPSPLARRLCRLPAGLLVAGLMVSCLSSPVRASGCQPPGSAPVSGASSPSSPASPALDATGNATTADARSLAQVEQWLTRLVIDEAGLEWSDDRKWGQQEQVWDGIQWRRDPGGRWETERKWKSVNHGSWEKYHARLRPGADSFRITLPRLATAADGASEISLQVDAVIDLMARQSQWVRGVQLYSLSAEGWARVTVAIDLRLTTTAEWSEIPPVMVLQPVIEQVRIQLHELQLDRVSKVGGEVSQQIGRAAEKVIRDKLAEKEPGIADRLNRQIDKHRDRLRFSAADLHLPDWVQQAIPAGSSSPAPAAGDPGPGAAVPIR